MEKWRKTSCKRKGVSVWNDSPQSTGWPSVSTSTDEYLETYTFCLRQWTREVPHYTIILLNATSTHQSSEDVKGEDWGRIGHPGRRRFTPFLWSNYPSNPSVTPVVLHCQDNSHLLRSTYRFTDATIYYIFLTEEYRCNRFIDCKPKELCRLF